MHVMKQGCFLGDKVQSTLRDLLFLQAWHVVGAQQRSLTGFVIEDSRSFLDAAAGILESREISACPGSVSCSNTVGPQKPGRCRGEGKDLVAWNSAKAFILRPASPTYSGI